MKKNESIAKDFFQFKKDERFFSSITNSLITACVVYSNKYIQFIACKELIKQDKVVIFLLDKLSKPQIVDGLFKIISDNKEELEELKKELITIFNNKSLQNCLSVAHLSD